MLKERVCCVLQGVHESRGVSDDYLKLESLIQKVVSPYLGTHGLYTDGGSVVQCSCLLGEQEFNIYHSPPMLGVFTSQLTE